MVALDDGGKPSLFGDGNSPVERPARSRVDPSGSSWGPLHRQGLICSPFVSVEKGRVVRLARLDAAFVPRDQANGQKVYAHFTDCNLSVPRCQNEMPSRWMRTTLPMRLACVLKAG